SGTFSSQAGFEQNPGHELGWLPMVTANTDAAAGAGVMTTRATGSTNHGNFTVDGYTATTVPAAAVGTGGFATAGVGVP
ncbi:hypothetical protein IAE22_35625, partial [Bacillus sp. S34]|nr:hypothetical protein [Bacillus sp. S34]